ncbi:lipoyl synthase [bacterium]|nr:lipoyl synthase [bacterium]
MAEPELEIPDTGSPEWEKNILKPEWLKVRIGTDRGYGAVNQALKSRCLHTVCQEARCPNISECWTSGTATFMIMGDICTRGCAYCAVKTGRPAPLDGNEPERVAQAVLSLKLDYAVITSVDRDDLPDGGAEHFASVIKAVRRSVPGCKIEVLIPDFGGDLNALERVLEAGPDVLNHNIETVKRLYKRLRAKGDYRRCLDILKYAKEHMPADKRTKSGLMVGLGESCREILYLMDDLRSAGTDVMTIGQYLRPSLKNVPVMKYRSPEEFAFFREEGLKRGFKFVEAGPLVRSSYRAASHFGA